MDLLAEMLGRRPGTHWQVKHRDLLMSAHAQRTDGRARSYRGQAPAHAKTGGPWSIGRTMLLD